MSKPLHDFLVGAQAVLYLAYKCSIYNYCMNQPIYLVIKIMFLVA
jgi:hypothetical protein